MALAVVALRVAFAGETTAVVLTPDIVGLAVLAKVGLDLLDRALGDIDGGRFRDV